MAETDIPTELIQSLREKKACLWLGPQVFGDAGCPDLAELMIQIKHSFESGPPLDPSAQGVLNAYFEREDWPRAAKFFHDNDRDRFHRALRQAYRLNPLQNPFEPPYYLRILQRLGFQRVLTREVAGYPEELFGDLETVTWADRERLEALQDDSCLVYLHGTAQRPETLRLTLDQEKAYRGEAGDPIRAFVRQTLSSMPCLLIGYPHDDPLFQWLADLFPDSDPPKVFWLQPSETMVTAPAWLKPVALETPSELMTELRGLDAWCAYLARQLEINIPAAPPPPKSGRPDWTTLTFAQLQSLPGLPHERIKGYYSGEQPAWQLVRDGHAIPRTVTPGLLERHEQGARAILVLAASCEGKTTLLKQAALVLMQRGYRLIEVHDNRSPVANILNRERGALVVVLYQAVHFYGLANIIHAAQQRGEPTLLLLEARTHEWSHAHDQAEILIRDLPRVTIEGMDHIEVTALVDKLLEQGVVASDVNPEEMVKRLLAKEKKGRFLLAAMLEATRGKSFSEILHQVVAEISGWLDGPQLIKALGIAVIIESLPNKSGYPFLCSEALFRETLGTASVETVSNRLKGEVQLRSTGNQIGTRDPLIAQTLFPTLFENGFLDEYDLCEDLLWAAGRLAYDPRNHFECSLLTIIPNHFIKRGFLDKAKGLLATATKAEPGHAPTWQVWARLAARMGHIGAPDEPGTARYLFKRATEADPQDAPSWQAWALMEAKMGNVGNVHHEGTARWLFKRATEANPQDAPSWQAWALLEAEKDNVGDIDRERTARWLFKRATEVDSQAAPSWQAWALLEAEQDHVGDIDQEGTARWLFRRATEADPRHTPSWRAWALMEHRIGKKAEALAVLKGGLQSLPNEKSLKRLRAQVLRESPSTSIPEAGVGQQAKPSPASTPDEDKIQSRSARVFSEYEDYLLIKEMLNVPVDATPPEGWLEALARLAPLLNKSVLTEPTLGRLKGEPEHLLAFPPAWFDSPDRRIKCFAATAEGQLIAFELDDAVADGGADRDTSFEPRMVHRFSAGIGTPDKVMGLYRNKPRMGMPELYLTLHKRRSVVAYRYSLDPRNQPTFLNKVENWMEVCPVATGLSTDLFQEYPPPKVPARAQSAAWLDGTLFLGNAHGKQGCIKGESLHVLGDRLLVIRRDQNLEAYQIGEDGKTQLEWQWFSPRQPLCLCPLSDIGTFPARFLLGFESGDIVPAVVMEAAWDSYLWSRLRERIIAHYRLERVEDWLNWTSGSLASDVAKALPCLGSGVLKLLFEFLLQQPNAQPSALAHWDHVFHPGLSMQDYAPLAATLFETTERWEREGAVRGACALLAIYQRLPYYYRDAANVALERHAERMGEPLSAPEGGEDEDYRAYRHLWDRRSITRSELSEKPDLGPDDCAAIHCEAWIHHSWLEYSCQGEASEDSYLRAGLEEGVVYWFQREKIFRMLPGDPCKREVTPADWATPANCLKLNQNISPHAVAGIGDGKVVRLQVRQGEGFATPPWVSFLPDGYDLVRAADAGGGLILIVVQPVREAGGQAELWLWCSQEGRLLATRRLPKEAPCEMVARVLQPGHSWLVAGDLSGGRVVVARISRLGDRLIFEQFFNRAVGGKVRSLAFIQRGDDKAFDLLVGTTRGHLTALDFTGDTPSLDPRWLHTTPSAVRHLDVLPVGTGYRVLELTAFGTLVVLDENGQLLWQRHMYTTFRSGAIFSSGAEKTVYVAVLDVRGVFSLFGEKDADSHKERVLEILQNAGQTGHFPHDELKAFQLLNAPEQLSDRTLADLSPRARVCLIKAIGEWLLNAAANPVFRKVFENMNSAFKLDDLETLAGLRFTDGQQEERLWLFVRVIKVLNRLLQEGSVVGGGALQANDRIAQLLIILVRGMGRGIITPEYLWRKSEDWQRIPAEIRNRPEVLAAVLHNALPAGDSPAGADALFSALLNQATWLGPAGFEALPLLAPTTRAVLCWNLASGIKTVGEKAENQHFSIPKSTGIEGPGGVFVSLCRFLADRQEGWEELTVVARQAEGLLAELSHETPPLFAYLLQMAALFSTRADHFLQPLESQLQTLAEMEAVRLVNPSPDTGGWQIWLEAALLLFIKRRNSAVSERRSYLQTLWRVRLAEAKVLPLERDMALLQARLVREGVPGGKTTVAVEVKPGGGMLAIDRPLRDAWDWLGLPEEPIQWTGRLDGSEQVLIRVTTQGPGGYRHDQDWPVDVPVSSKSGEDFLDNLPAVIDSFVAVVLSKTAGNHILAYDDRLGTAALIRAFLNAGHLRAIELDPHLQHRGPERREAGGFDAVSLMRLLGCERTPQDLWHLPGKGYRGVFVHLATDTFSRLLAPAHGTILTALLEELKKRTGVPLFWFLPLSLANRLQTAGYPSLNFVPLYSIAMETNELPAELSGKLAQKRTLAASEVRNSLNALDGNLRLLAHWLADPQPVAELLDADEVVGELMRQELSHLHPLDYANLIVLAFSRTLLEKTAMRPGMQPAEVVSGDPTRVWVKGYCPDTDGDQHVPEELQGLLKLGRTDSQENHQRCRLLLQGRGILQIDGEAGFVYLTRPFQRWLEKHTDLKTSGKHLIETLLGRPFLFAITFKAMAAAGDTLGLLGDVNREGLQLIEPLYRLFHNGGTSADFKILAERLTGEHVYTLEEAKVSTGSSLEQDLDGLIGLENIVQVERDGGQRHWLGFVTRAIINGLEPLARTLKPWREKITVTLLGPGVAEGFAARGNLCAISEAQLKDLVTSPRPSEDFWLLVRNQFGLKRFSPYQVGSALLLNSKVFVGREREVDIISGAIDRRSFLILGGRQIGKTSLLWHLYGKLLLREDLTPLFLSLEGIRDAEGLQIKLNEACLEKSLPISGYSNPVEQIVATLRGLFRPVLFINEVDGLVVNAVPVLQRLRALSEEGRCQFIMAGYHGAYGGVQDTRHPLFNWTQGEDGEKALVLGSLTHAAALQLVDKLETSRLSLRWENPEARTLGREILLKRSYRIPILLQGACDRLVTDLDEERRFVIRLDDVQHPKGRGQNPVWDYLNKIKSSVLNPLQFEGGQTPLESYWSRLVLATAVNLLYFQPDPAPIDNQQLDLIPAANLHFDIAAMVKAVDAQLYQAGFGGLIARMRVHISAEAYQRLLDFWTLTVILSPSRDHQGAYFFKEHIYPLELSKYLARNKASMKTYLAGLVGNLNSVLPA